MGGQLTVGLVEMLSGAAAIGVLSALMGLLAGRVVRQRPAGPEGVEALVAALDESVLAGEGVEGLGSAGRSGGDVAERLAARLADLRVRDLNRRLEDAQAEASRLRAQYVAVVDAKDAEIGRLESAALSALDGTVARLQARITRLEDDAVKAYAQAEAAERERDAERRTVARLRAVLDGRPATV